METEAEIIRQKMFFPEFPYYLSFFKLINNKTDTVKVEIQSKVHKGNIFLMPHTWTKEFIAKNPGEFRDDVFRHTINRFGLKRQPVKYL